MTDKTKILIAVGGTGGHVFPGYNLSKHLAEQKYSLELVTDIRGFKYLNNLKDLDISILPSSPIITNILFPDLDFLNKAVLKYIQITQKQL